MAAPSVARNRTVTLRTLSPVQKTVVAAGVYVVWTAATYLLEGRIQTLLRPAATGDRLAYAVVANLFVGTVLGLWVVREFVAGGFTTRDRLGFHSLPRTLAAVLVAGVLGFGAYALQGPASMDPMVVTNAFAQVLNVSTAEIVVCWVVVGGSVEALLRGRGWNRRSAVAVALLTSSVLFGGYHLAHSPPFDTPSMILVLTGVGLATGLVYFAGGGVYGALLFHNFMALFGVTRALAGSGQLAAYGEPVVPLLATAAVSLLVLVVADVGLVRRASTG